MKFQLLLFTLTLLARTTNSQSVIADKDLKLWYLQPGKCRAHIPPRYLQMGNLFMEFLFENKEARNYRKPAKPRRKAS
jgi:hypothetical protein